VPPDAPEHWTRISAARFRHRCSFSTAIARSPPWGNASEAVQRPTMKFVVTKTADRLDLQALHRVRERLVSQRTGIINRIRAFLLERGVGVRQGLWFLRAELPRILAAPAEVLSPQSTGSSSVPTRSVKSLDTFMVEHEFRDRARNICVPHQRKGTIVKNEPLTIDSSCDHSMIFVWEEVL
jgi:hypothetical protein